MSFIRNTFHIGFNIINIYRKKIKNEIINNSEYNNISKWYTVISNEEVRKEIIDYGKSCANEFIQMNHSEI